MAVGALHEVLRLIADGLAPRVSTATLGAIQLLPHQADAVHRLQQILQRYGGALLADPVGTGKTFTALGVAATYPSAAVVAPAGLRSMWAAAISAVGRRYPITSYEQLSRQGALPDRARLIILDEAHNARTPSARRYDQIARLTTGAHVLLLSATPLHNRLADLHAMFALFLGSQAYTLSSRDLAPLVVRRDALADTLMLPDLASLRWHRVQQSAAVLRSLLAIPAPIATVDGGTAAALTRLMLVRQWSSSNAALDAALARAVRRAIILRDELAQGRNVRTADVTRALIGLDAWQLSFCLAPAHSSVKINSSASVAVERYIRAVRATQAQLRTNSNGDTHRWQVIAVIIKSHAPGRAVLFTHSAATARACYRALVHTTRVACLDGQGATIAHGRLTRDELVAAFRPGRTQARAMSIDVLVTTDVLSEGVDLHDASLVMHLDLPWTVARLAQRVGRLKRIGSPHAVIQQHTLAPQVNGERVVQILRRLACKARIADQIAAVDPMLGILDTSERGARDGDMWAEAAAIAAAWNTVKAVNDCPSEPVVAAACTTHLGPRSFIAVLSSSCGPMVVTGSGDGISGRAEHVLAAIRTVRERPSHLAADDAAKALEHITGWLAAEEALGDSLASLPLRSATHRGLVTRLRAMQQRCPRGQRAQSAAIVARLSQLLARCRGIGAERAIERCLASCPAGAVRGVTPAILHAIREVLEEHAAPVVVSEAPRVIAVLLLSGQ